MMTDQDESVRYIGKHRRAVEHPRFVTGRGRFAADIASQFDFIPPDTDAIATAVASAVRALLAYSFEPSETGQISIEFERVAEGLRVRLRDKGLPFDVDSDGKQTRAAAGDLPLEKLQAQMDEVYLNNRYVERLRVVQFENPESLQKIGGNLYQAGDETVEKAAVRFEVQQGFLESSNVNPVEEMVQLVEIQRQFESLQRMVRTLDEAFKLAAEQVGKV